MAGSIICLGYWLLCFLASLPIISSTVCTNSVLWGCSLFSYTAYSPTSNLFVTINLCLCDLELFGGFCIDGFYFDFKRCLLWLSDDYRSGVPYGLGYWLSLLFCGEYIVLEGDTPGEGEKIRALFCLWGNLFGRPLCPSIFITNDIIDKKRYLITKIRKLWTNIVNGTMRNISWVWDQLNT